jgi:dephospho-CoA kinase
MQLYGITGGIGMGKSTLGGLLRQAGLPVIDCDDLARQLVEPGQPALTEIGRAFGPEVLDPSGRLRRSELARRVFTDVPARRRLEAILHPRIRSAWLAQAERWRAEGRPQGFVIVPLLFETGAETAFPTVWCVACTTATQRERWARRGWPEAELRERSVAQMPVEEKMRRADVVFWNEGPPDVLLDQLRRTFR